MLTALAAQNLGVTNVGDVSDGAFVGGFFALLVLLMILGIYLIYVSITMVNARVPKKETAYRVLGYIGSVFDPILTIIVLLFFPVKKGNSPK